MIIDFIFQNMTNIQFDERYLTWRIYSQPKSKNPPYLRLNSWWEKTELSSNEAIAKFGPKNGWNKENKISSVILKRTLKCKYYQSHIDDGYERSGRSSILYKLNYSLISRWSGRIKRRSSKIFRSYIRLLFINLPLAEFSEVYQVVIFSCLVVTTTVTRNDRELSLCSARASSVYIRSSPWSICKSMVKMTSWTMGTPEVASKEYFEYATNFPWFLPRFYRYFPAICLRLTLAATFDQRTETPIKSWFPVIGDDMFINRNADCSSLKIWLKIMPGSEGEKSSSLGLPGEIAAFPYQ